MNLLKAIKTQAIIRQREIKTRLGCFVSSCSVTGADLGLFLLPSHLMYKTCIHFPEFWIFSAPPVTPMVGAEVKMDGKHNCLHFTAELCTQLYGRHHTPSSWLSGYPICTHIRHQRCRIRKSGFKTAYCHNLLINFHWKCETYPPAW